MRMRLIGRTLAGILTIAGLAVAVPAGPASAAGCAPIGTVGIPNLLSVEGTVGLSSLKIAPASARLPKIVNLRDNVTTFNKRWAFALAGGKVYTHPRKSSGPWRLVPLPGCINGHVRGISADDQQLLAIDRTGQFYTMDNAEGGPAQWNWSSRWGTPFWIGLGGQKLPPGTKSWAFSVISPAEDKYWLDPAGNKQYVGDGKVSHVYALTGAGNRIVLMDPWLPSDYSYQVQTPLNGRFKAVRLSASGSTLFVIDKYGDMYTRLYDFDMSGADTVFFRYSYDNQRGKPDAPNYELARLNSNYAAIQLPAVGWIHQPKIPGAITSDISVAKTGVGSNARELTVAGRRDGINGIWHKAVHAHRWTFTPTRQRLLLGFIANPRATMSSRVLAPAPTLTFSGSTNAYRATVSGFDIANESTPLTLTFPDGSSLRLRLYTVNPLRQTARAAVLDSHPWKFTGAIEVTPAVRRLLAHQTSQAAKFATVDLGNRRFTTASVSVTTASMTISALLGLSLRS